MNCLHPSMWSTHQIMLEGKGEKRPKFGSPRLFTKSTTYLGARDAYMHLKLEDLFFHQSYTQVLQANIKVHALERKVYHFVAYIDGVCTVEFTKKDILGLVAERDLIPLRFFLDDLENHALMSFFFFSLDVSPSFETPLALVLEDDVLDLRLVLENALACVLRLLHLHMLTGQF